MATLPNETVNGGGQLVTDKQLAFNEETFNDRQAFVTGGPTTRETFAELALMVDHPLHQPVHVTDDPDANLQGWHRKTSPPGVEPATFVKTDAQPLTGTAAGQVQSDTEQARDDAQAAQAAAEQARDDAEAAEANAAADAAQTAADRVQTGADRTQTGLDRTATEAARAEAERLAISSTLELIPGELQEIDYYSETGSGSRDTLPDLALASIDDTPAGNAVIVDAATVIYSKGSYPVIDGRDIRLQYRLIAAADGAGQEVSIGIIYLDNGENFLAPSEADTFIIDPDLTVADGLQDATTQVTLDDNGGTRKRWRLFVEKKGTGTVHWAIADAGDVTDLLSAQQAAADAAGDAASTAADRAVVEANLLGAFADDAAALAAHPAPETGARYFNTVSLEDRQWNGAAFQSIDQPPAAPTQPPDDESNAYANATFVQSAITERSLRFPFTDFAAEPAGGEQDGATYIVAGGINAFAGFNNNDIARLTGGEWIAHPPVKSRIAVRDGDGYEFIYGVDWRLREGQAFDTSAALEALQKSQIIDRGVYRRKGRDLVDDFAEATVQFLADDAGAADGFRTFEPQGVGDGLFHIMRRVPRAEDFGIRGDGDGVGGGTDNTAAVQALLNSKLDCVFDPTLFYRLDGFCTSPLDWAATWEGPWFDINNQVATANESSLKMWAEDLGLPKTLPADLGATATQVDLDPGDGLDFSPGQRVLFYSDALWNNATCRTSQWVLLDDVIGDTLYFTTQLKCSFLTADNARVYPDRSQLGGRLLGVSAVGDGATNQEFFWGLLPHGLVMQDCYAIDVVSRQFRLDLDYKSRFTNHAGDNATRSGLGYVMAVAGGHDGDYGDIRCSNSGHGFTGGDGASGYTGRPNIPQFILMHDFTCGKTDGTDMLRSIHDLHGGATDGTVGLVSGSMRRGATQDLVTGQSGNITYAGARIRGAARHGFLIQYEGNGNETGRKFLNLGPVTGDVDFAGGGFPYLVTNDGGAGDVLDVLVLNSPAVAGDRGIDVTPSDADILRMSIQAGSVSALQLNALDVKSTSAGRVKAIDTFGLDLASESTGSAYAAYLRGLAWKNANAGEPFAGVMTMHGGKCDSLNRSAMRNSGYLVQRFGTQMAAGAAQELLLLQDGGVDLNNGAGKQNIRIVGDAITGYVPGCILEAQAESGNTDNLETIALATILNSHAGAFDAGRQAGTGYPLIIRALPGQRITLVHNVAAGGFLLPGGVNNEVDGDAEFATGYWDEDVERYRMVVIAFAETP